MKTFQLWGPPTLPNDSYISSADDNDDNSDAAVAAADDDDHGDNDHDADADGFMDKAALGLDRVLIKRETGNKNPANKACQFVLFLFWLQLQ